MHHTRFFPEDPSDGDRNGNIRPGTCVDTGITSKYEFDFYLNSHAGIQGDCLRLTLLLDSSAVQERINLPTTMSWSTKMVSEQMVFKCSRTGSAICTADAPDLCLTSQPPTMPILRRFTGDI